ncbi:ABC transporter permease [Lysobacter korlensis]|uniref:ABC transporter permease n=1 Tax=Lysobacter korlensis TaxID=553636 RepID=A0ABV6RZ69_9GAMM
MATFVIRRLIASFFVLLAATYIMYVLTALSGDPLEDLRASTAPNAAQLIERRIDLLHLDVPPYLRYFIWLGGVSKCVIGQCDLGYNVQGQPVIALLENALGQTLQLVTTAAILAIIIGVIVGIVTALRQYSGFDYGVTFIAFLFFSLPIFWVAVLLKQYIAIGFNDFLRNPDIPPIVIVIAAILSGVVWAAVAGGNWRRRGIVFGVATAVTAGILFYMSATDWFLTPGLGIVLITLTGIAAAVGITAVSTGLKNRRSLYASLTVVALGVALYYPLQFIFGRMTMPLFLGLAVVTILVGGVIGWFWGGNDRWQVARTAALVAVIMGGLIAIDEYMSYWEAYSNSSRVRGRPIATIGSVTPNLGGNFWVQGVDSFTHLLLPTIALILVSVASYTRYTRSSMLEVMNQDYIRTARAKGLTERTVIVRHAFRNALIPIATIVAFDVGAIVGGAVITERVFAWTGMGALFINGLDRVDPNPVMAFFLVTGALAIIFNLIADLVYAALDPRIRLS